MSRHRAWLRRVGDRLARLGRKLESPAAPSAPPACPMDKTPVPEVDLSRRRLGAALLGAGAVLGTARVVRAKSSGERPAPRIHHTAAAGRPQRIGSKTHRWSMAIDLDRCSACGACTIACRQENNVPVLGPEPVNEGAHIEWMSMLWQESGEPGGLPEMLPFPCQHCETAPCTKVCPVGATYKDHEGITAQIWERCIGCRYCMAACPYSRRSFNWAKPEYPGTTQQYLNPDVATRSMGVVEKCTFCHHRIQDLKERAAVEGRDLTDEELKYLPACAAACPAKAITFGDLDDPEGTVTRLSESPRVYRLLEHLGTKPRVFYLRRDRRA